MKKREAKKLEEFKAFETREEAEAAALGAVAAVRAGGHIVMGLAATFFTRQDEGIRAAIHPDTAGDTLRVKRMIRRDGFEPLTTIRIV